MILLDANLLIYAFARSMREHDSARSWLDEQLNGAARVGIPWPSLLAFLRITTNRRVFVKPASTRTAWRQVNDWLDCEPVWVPEPTRRHREVLGDLLVNSQVRADLVPDAHLAALAIEHGVELCTTDRDFARFDGLRWRNPLGG